MTPARPAGGDAPARAGSTLGPCVTAYSGVQAGSVPIDRAPGVPAGSPREAWQHGSPGGGGSSRRRRKSFGQTRHPRWLSGCPLSGSDRVIPKPSLSEGQILPWHRSPLLALGDCGGPGRACQGTAVAGSSCSISRPAPPRCRWPHPHCGQQPELLLGTLAPAVSPQEASFYF